MDWSKVFSIVIHVASGITAIGGAITTLRKFIKERNKIGSEMQSAFHVLVNRRRIFLWASVAELVIITGLGIAFSPLVFSNASDSVILTGDTIATAGLVLSLVTWMAALVVSFKLQRWDWLLFLVLIGGILYAAALFISDIYSYVLVSAVPAIFAVRGPRPSRSKIEGMLA